MVPPLNLIEISPLWGIIFFGSKSFAVSTKRIFFLLRILRSDVEFLASFTSVLIITLIRFAS